MSLSVPSNDSDGRNGGNGSASIAANIVGNANNVPSINGASNVLNRHHNQPPPVLDSHWQDAQHSATTPPLPWTSFGTDNRARAASNPNPGPGSSRRPSLRVHINQYQPQPQYQQQQQPQVQYQQRPGQQQAQYSSQGPAMSVIPAPVPPPPRPDFLIGQGHLNPSLLSNQPQHYQLYNPQPDRRLPLPHVPAATNQQRVPDLHAQNDSRSPSPCNTATTAASSTGAAFVPSPFGGAQTATPIRGTGSAGGSTPSTGSSNSSKRSAGLHGQLPFSTPSGSTSSPNLNSTLPVVEEYSPSPQLPASAVGCLLGVGTTGAGAGRRPLPMPPPSRPGSRNANHVPAGPRVNSPLRSAPARAINDRGHTRSRSDVEISLENVMSLQQSEKSIASETKEAVSEPVDPEMLPYHERSDKWKGKQKMRDLPPSPTSPTSSLPVSASPEGHTRSSPVFMNSAFPTNSLRQTPNPTPPVTAQPRNSPSLPTLNLSYRQREVKSQPVHSASATTTNTVIPPPPPLPTSSLLTATDPSTLSIVTNPHLPTISPPLIPPYPTGVDLPPSLSSFKSPISAKSTVTSGGISKRIIKRSGSVSSIRSNSSWRSSKSGHSAHGQWSANKFTGKDKEQSTSASSSPVVSGLGSVPASNGMFNYDNDYSSYTPTTPHSAKQPPTPRLQIPTTPSFVSPPPPLPNAASIPTTARLPLPPPPPINTATQPIISLIPPATSASQHPPLRKNAKANKYFIANRTSMESIASLAVSVKDPAVKGAAGPGLGSVDSFASNATSTSSGSGGSVVTVDAASGALYSESVSRHSQESFSTYSTHSDSTSSSMIKSDDTPDTPTFQEDIGHAHDGYDVDDERVYIDHGLDNYPEELQDLGEFQAAPGSPDENASEDSDWDSGIRRVKGGMTFARNAGDNDPDIVSDKRTSSRSATEKKGSQKGKGKHRSKGKEKEKKKDKDKDKDNRKSKVKTAMIEHAIEGYVHVTGGGSLSRYTTAVSKGRASPPLPALPSPLPVVPPAMPASHSQHPHQPALPLSPPLPPELTGEVLDDPDDILGGEMEMVFATGSESRRDRRHGSDYVLGLGGVGLDDHEDKVFVRGKWRMRSLSPGDRSPLSPGLRRYQSEESMHGSSFEDERAHTMPVHAEPPVRLAPNRYMELPEQRLANGFSMTDGCTRSKSHQARSSVSIPPPSVQTTPIVGVNKPLPPHVLNHDYSAIAPTSAVVGGGGAFMGSAAYPHYTFVNQDAPPTKKDKDRESMPASGAFLGAGGIPAPFVFLNSDKKEKERLDTNSIRSKQSTKSKAVPNIKRGLSMPGEPPKEHVRRQLDSLAPKQVSYEVWVERGLGAAPELPRKKLTKAQI